MPQKPQFLVSHFCPNLHIRVYLRQETQIYILLWVNFNQQHSDTTLMKLELNPQIISAEKLPSKLKTKNLKFS